MTQENRDYVLQRSTGYLPGLIVIAVGLLFLLGNLNVLPLHSWWQLWPVAVIAVGVTRLVDSAAGRDGSAWRGAAVSRMPPRVAKVAVAPEWRESV